MQGDACWNSSKIDNCSCGLHFNVSNFALNQRIRIVVSSGWARGLMVDEGIEFHYTADSCNGIEFHQVN